MKLIAKKEYGEILTVGKLYQCTEWNKYLYTVICDNGDTAIFSTEYFLTREETTSILRDKKLKELGL